MLQVVAAYVIAVKFATFTLIVAAARDARAMGGKSSRQKGDAGHQRRHDRGEELHLQERKDAQ
jgi:hypothetical protein